MVEPQRIVDEAVAWGAQLHLPERADHPVARRDGPRLRGAGTPRPAHPGHHRRRDDLRPPHGGEDRPGLFGRGGPLRERQPQQPDTGAAARPRRRPLRRQGESRPAGPARGVRPPAAGARPHSDRRSARGAARRGAAPNPSCRSIRGAWSSPTSTWPTPNRTSTGVSSSRRGDSKGVTPRFSTTPKRAPRRARSSPTPRPCWPASATSGC